MPSSACKTCALDRKSTRLNSSHTLISYAVFCLKKKFVHHALVDYLGRFVVATRAPREHCMPDVAGCFSFFFNDTATTEIYTLSLHDALPICTRLNSSHTLISYAVLLEFRRV